MKILKSIVIFGLLFSVINCRCSSSDGEEDDDSFNYVDKTASKKNCPKREFSSDEKEDNAYKCCYFETECKPLGIKTSYKGCEPVTKTEYDDIKEYIKATKEIGNCNKLNVQCSGNALKKLLYSSFILLFIL